MKLHIISRHLYLKQLSLVTTRYRQLQVVSALLGSCVDCEFLEAAEKAYALRFHYNLMRFQCRNVFFSGFSLGFLLLLV